MRDTYPRNIQAHHVRHGMIIATPSGRSAVRTIKRQTVYPPGMRARNEITITTANGETQTFEFYAIVQAG
jgi:hypothetical protein